MSLRLLIILTKDVMMLLKTTTTNLDFRIYKLIDVKYISIMVVKCTELTF